MRIQPGNAGMDAATFSGIKFTCNLSETETKEGIFSVEILDLW